MIVGKLEQLSLLKGVAPQVVSILEPLVAELLAGSTSGKHPIDGDKLFFNVTEAQTEKLANRRSEVHQEYADIQVLLKGSERFGYSIEPLAKITDDQFATRDIAFGEVASEKFVDIHEGEFIVFPAGCPHRPLVAIDEQPATVLKAVFKVHRSLFE